MVDNMRHIYIHDANSSSMGIGYNNIEDTNSNLFSKNMVG